MGTAFGCICCIAAALGSMPPRVSSSNISFKRRSRALVPALRVSAWCGTGCEECCQIIPPALTVCQPSRGKQATRRNYCTNQHVVVRVPSLLGLVQLPACLCAGARQKRKLQAPLALGADASLYSGAHVG